MNCIMNKIIYFMANNSAAMNNINYIFQEVYHIPHIGTSITTIYKHSADNRMT